MFLSTARAGTITSSGFVCEGSVSGSFVLMLLGAYEPIVKIIGDITNFSNLGHNLFILIPFGIGVVLGVIVIAKILEFLFSKYEVSTYYAILGFIVSSIIALFTVVLGVKISTIELIIGAILCLLGILVGYKLGDE